MPKIQILDCTLRDGGYVNDFRFGKYGIQKIINQLTDSGIDIVECGFLEDGDYDPNCTVFQTAEQIRGMLPSQKKHTLYVAMACYGEYSADQLSDYDGTSIDGVRVSFHYNEVESAMEFCRQIKKKGYKIFIQPIGTTSYSQEQLLSLIQQVNDLRPYSFYFVDTLGLMHKDDVLNMFNFIDQHLHLDIHIGFHSHNNLQLSYSNGQALAELETDRFISLDSSVYGMGRGAGNLNTELIANHINEQQGRTYEIEPLLEIVDEFSIPIREEHKWGYSVPYYLAAINGCHPNYASFLSDKQTLNVKSISTILRMIEPEQRSLFNKELAEQKYLEFQAREIDDTKTIELLSQKIQNKDVLLLAPGTSIHSFQKEIEKQSQNCIVFAIAFVPDYIKCDYVFFSNLKRYHTISKDILEKVNLIHTSNLQVDEADKLVVNYSSLLNEADAIMDNAALMAFNLLVRIHPHKVFVAGLDGYKYGSANYFQTSLRQEQDEERFKVLNQEISERIRELQTKIDIQFITPSLYIAQK